MVKSSLTNIHTRKIITEKVIFHNLHMSKYEIVKKKPFINIKHDLIMGRDMPETCRRKNFNKKHGFVKKFCYFSTYWICNK